MHRYTESFARHGLAVGQVLLTAEDVTRRSHYRNAHRTLDKLLAVGAVPIVNENDTVATEEIRFGDNDRLAALVAHLVDADLLVLLSDVDGLYDGDPSRAGLRSLRSEVHGEADLAGSSSAGPVAPGSAPAGCRRRSRPPASRPRAGIPVVLAQRGRRRTGAGAASRSARYFHPTGRRTGARLLWLAHATRARAGACTWTPGAVAGGGRAAACRCCRPGITASTATSSRAIRSTFSTKTATRWPAAWSTSMRRELPDLLGRSTRELARTLGPATSARSSTGTTSCCWRAPSSGPSGVLRGWRMVACRSRSSAGMWHVDRHRLRARPVDLADIRTASNGWPTSDRSC